MQLLCQDGQDLYLAMDATESTSECSVEARQGARELRLPGQSLTRSSPRWHLPGIQPKLNRSTPKCFFLGLLPKICRNIEVNIIEVFVSTQRPRNSQALFSILITRDRTRCAIEVPGVSKRIGKMYANLSGTKRVWWRHDHDSDSRLIWEANSQRSSPGQRLKVKEFEIYERV